MSKFGKTIGKFNLWAIVGAILLAAGILVAALFGLNADPTVSDGWTMTIKLDSGVSAREERVDKVKELCEKEFDDAGLKDAYTLYGENSDGAGEIVYFFSAAAEENKKQETKSAVEKALSADEELKDASILYVTVNNETVAASLPSGYIWRAVVAGAVILAIEFIYISVRYKLNMGIAGAASSLVGVLLTLALVALTRIPVTTSVVYVAAFAMLYTALLSMFIFNRMRENFKTDEYKEMPADEAIASSVPVKGILVFAAATAIALILVGAIAVASVRWFALAALAAVAAGTFASLLFMPAMYLPMKKAADKRAAERARYDYKKTSKDKKEASADATKDEKKAAQEN